MNPDVTPYWMSLDVNVLSKQKTNLLDATNIKF